MVRGASLECDPLQGGLFPHLLSEERQENALMITAMILVVASFSRLDLEVFDQRCAFVLDPDGSMLVGRPVEAFSQEKSCNSTRYTKMKRVSATTIRKKHVLFFFFCK